jgi:hypothetical protein
LASFPGKNGERETLKWTNLEALVSIWIYVFYFYRNLALCHSMAMRKEQGFSLKTPRNIYLLLGETLKNSRFDPGTSGRLISDEKYKHKEHHDLP